MMERSSSPAAPSVLITEFMDEAAVRDLAAAFDTHYDPTLHARPAELAGPLGAARALIVRNQTRVDAHLLAHAPHLRVVGRLGVGLENIDLDACRARRIEVVPAVGANAAAVAEYVLCTAMMLLRGAYGGAVTDEVAAGRWPRARLAGGREIGGRTLGVIGLGSVGQHTVALARAAGMQAAAFDPALAADHPAWLTAQRHPDLDTLLAAADVVSVHVPLLPATRGLLDARRLARMRPGSVLINVARGGVVDETALANALRSGALAGAAVDVFDTEPLAAGSPLAGAPNLLLTPHIAGVTTESNQRVSALIARRVADALRATA